MKKFNYFKSVVCLVIMLFTLVGCEDNKTYYIDDNKSSTTANNVEVKDTTEKENESDDWETAQEAFDKINVGWNLGNSLECCDGKIGMSTKSLETAWGISATTQETIDSVAEQGFKMVRIPVTYRNYIDEDGNINKEWLDRVEEVVNYAISKDLYCVINVHHDTGNGGWIVAEPEIYEENKEKLENLWTQIAERFKDYDEKLMFEGFNEVLDSDKTWSDAKDSAYEVMNDYNQLFVDAVRATGGNNSYRNLIVNTYAAKAENKAISKFVLPKDSVENHIAVGVHIYCGYDSIEWFMDSLKPIRDNNIPVFIGEFGIQAKDKSIDARVEYVEKFMSEASDRNITCAWWDDGLEVDDAKDVYNFALMNRKTYEWYFPEIVDSLTKDY